MIQATNDPRRDNPARSAIFSAIYRTAVCQLFCLHLVILLIVPSHQAPPPPLHHYTGGVPQYTITPVWCPNTPLHRWGAPIHHYTGGVPQYTITPVECPNTPLHRWGALPNRVLPGGSCSSFPITSPGNLRISLTVSEKAGIVRSCAPVWTQQAGSRGPSIDVSCRHTTAQWFKTARYVADINNRQTTESISVVLVSIESVSSGHLVVKNNLTWGYWFRSQIR